MIFPTQKEVLLRAQTIECHHRIIIFTIYYTTIRKSSKNDKLVLDRDRGGNYKNNKNSMVQNGQITSLFFRLVSYFNDISWIVKV